MTINTTSRKAGPFTGTGLQTAFPFSFKVFQAADLRVVITSAAGVETDQVISEQYTVALSVDQDSGPGGTVTMLVAPPAGSKLTIASVVPVTQGQSIPNNSGFYPKIIENALDKLTIGLQQVAEQVSRTLRFAISDSNSGTLPTAAQRADKLLGFDANGNLVAVSPAAQSAAALAVSLLTSAGASMVGFIGNGVGAILRTLQGKLREYPSVQDYGAVGDGSTSDYAAFLAAIAANPGKVIRVPDPAVAYVLDGATLTLPAKTRLKGEGKWSTKLLHAFNGDAFILGDGAGLSELYLEGQGASFTGRGLVLNNTDGRQLVEHCRVINFSNYCVDFTALLAGSQSYFHDCEIAQYNAATGSGKWAVNMLEGFINSAVPRKFVAIETNGTPAFNLAGSNDVFILGSFLGDLAFTSNSRGCNIVATRIANQAALTIDGHNNSLVGCDINPQITIAAGADAITVGPGSFNNLTGIVDNSGNSRNNIYHWLVAFTSALTSGGTAPSLGNGSLVGLYSRQGSTVTVDINLNIGSTTSLGTGGLSFALPFARKSGDIVVGGTVVMNRGGTIYTGFCQIAGAVATMSLLRDTTGSITFNSPATFASGDTIRLSITYLI